MKSVKYQIWSQFNPQQSTRVACQIDQQLHYEVWKQVYEVYYPIKRLT